MQVIGWACSRNRRHRVAVITQLRQHVRFSYDHIEGQGEDLRLIHLSPFFVQLLRGRPGREQVLAIRHLSIHARRREGSAVSPQQGPPKPDQLMLDPLLFNLSESTDIPFKLSEFVDQPFGESANCRRRLTITVNQQSDLARGKVRLGERNMN